MKLKLSTHKFRALSQISSDVGQIVFASVVVSPIIAGLSGDQWYIMIIGIIISLTIWVMALNFAEKGKL